MKVIRCSLVILLFPLFVLAGNDGEKAEKKISKEFNIRSDGHVELNNKYGNMDIAIGPDDKVKVDIVISATAGSAKKAQETLDRIDIIFEEGNNRVSVTTEIETSSGGWGNWFNTGNVDMDIHFQVLVPADVFLDLSNKYGNIYLETTNRDIAIELKYGGMRLGDINAKLNLEMAYSDGSISQIGDGAFNLAYSDLEMEDGKDITMDVKYTDIKAGTFNELTMVSAYSDFRSNAVGEMKYTGKYDDIIIDQVNTIHAQTGYTGIELQELSGEGKFDMRYGDLNIENIRRSFSRLDINTSYTGVDLEFQPDVSFSLDAETNYCDIQHKGLKMSENVVKGSSRILKASRGAAGDGQVVVRMNYGELSIQ